MPPVSATLPFITMATEPVKDLVSLPTDIFNLIVENVLHVVGFRKALGLQRTCKLFDVTIEWAICNDYLHNSHGPVDAAMGSSRDVFTYNFYRISPRIGCAILIAQNRRDPDHPVLAPIRKALHALNKVGDQTSKETAENERAVYKALTEQVCWHVERDPNGFRKMTLLPNRRNQADANPVLAVERESQNHLNVAIISGNVAAVRNFVSSADPNLYSKYFGRPLFLAARYGSVEIIQALLDHGADMNVTQNSNFVERVSDAMCAKRNDFIGRDATALELTALSGHEDAVKLLVFKDKYVTTSRVEVMRFAARRGSQALILFLLEQYRHHWSPDSKSDDSLSCTHDRIFKEAYRWGNAEIMKWYLDTKLAGIMNEDMLLICAAQASHTRVVKMLVDRGLRGLVQISDHVALLSAADTGNESCVNILLDFDSDPNGTTWVREGVFETVAQKGHLHILKLLLEMGWDLHTRGNDGPTEGEKALRDAIEYGSMQVARFLVNSGVHVNNKNQQFDPVLLAKMHGRTQFLKWLMSLGAHDVNPADSFYASEFRGRAYFQEGPNEDELFITEGKY